MPIESRAPTVPLAPIDVSFYAATVLIWGTTWLAVKWQVGPVAPEVSLLWRFLIAAPLMVAVALMAGLPLRFPSRDHARFAALGLLMFSANFILFYHAAAYVVSGLLGVIFSLAAIVNVVLARVFFGTRPGIRAVAGALLGIAGVAMLFLREGMTGGTGPLVGLALGVLGTLSFCSGNMVSAALQREGVPAASGAAWGMVYGIAFNLLAVLAFGRPFLIEETPRYLGSLLYLAVPGSVAAFWLYLTLLGRIGPGPAAYTTVVSPVLALVVSTLVEDYRWTPAAFAGLALVALGNVLVLGAGPSRRGK